MTTEMLIVLVAVAIVLAIYYVLVYRPAHKEERNASQRYVTSITVDTVDEEGEDEEDTVQDSPRFESHFGWDTTLSIVILVAVIATAVFNYQTAENVRKVFEVTLVQSGR